VVVKFVKDKSFFHKGKPLGGSICFVFTHPKTNISSENSNGWKMKFPFKMVPFLGDLFLIFGKGMVYLSVTPSTTETFAVLEIYSSPLKRYCDLILERIVFQPNTKFSGALAIKLRGW